jgi:hypothetical protein
VPGSVLAIATSDNAPGGAILTFAFPIILFAVIATVLYILLFSRPHPRVPAGRVALAGTAAKVGPAAKRDAAAEGSTTGGSVTGERDQGTTENTEASE